VKLADNEIVHACWYSQDENRAISFQVIIKRATVVEREGNWHFIGWDENGKGYYLGNAILTCKDEELHKP
jgi:hypothetical protein